MAIVAAKPEGRTDSDGIVRPPTFNHIKKFLTHRVQDGGTRACRCHNPMRCVATPSLARHAAQRLSFDLSNLIDIMYSKADAFVQQHPASIVVAFLILGYAMAWSIPGNLGIPVAHAFLSVGFALSAGYLYKENNSQPRRRIFFALLCMCLASDVGIDFVDR